MKLNLSKFKVKSKDKKSAVLVHPEGHEFKISISSLNPENRKLFDEIELSAEEPKNGEKKKMAEGGEAEPDFFHFTDEDLLPNQTAKIQEGLPSQTSQLASLGQSNMDDANAEVIPSDQKTAYDGESLQTESARGNAVVSSEPKPAQQMEDTTALKINPDSVINSNISVPASSPSNTQKPELNVSPESAVDPSNIYKHIVDAYDQQAKSQKEIANLEAQAEEAKAKALTNQVGTLAKIQKDYETKVKALDSEYNAIMEDYKNGHIDPNRYMGSMDTTSKIGTAIGLALGGLGGALTGHSNQALDFINRQIDRDIEAQKAELGKKETLLSHFYRQYGNLNTATEAAKSSMLAISQAQLQQIQAKAASPIAKQRAMLIDAAITQQKNKALQDFAQTQMLIQLESPSSGNGQSNEPSRQQLAILRLRAPEKAKEIEARLVPGVGLAKIPVPADDRRTIVAKQTLDRMANDFYEWSKKHSGSLNFKDINTGKTKAAELQSLYRNAINGGVFKKGEQEFIDQIVDSDPTKFFNSIRVLPKLKEVIDSNRQQLNVMKKSFDLPVQEQQEPEYKIVNGIKYMRGPKGEAIPVG